MFFLIRFSETAFFLDNVRCFVHHIAGVFVIQNHLRDRNLFTFEIFADRQIFVDQMVRRIIKPFFAYELLQSVSNALESAEPEAIYLPPAFAV